MTSAERAAAKWAWAHAHPGHVRESNRQYRRRNLQRVRAQTAARMRRLRARRSAAALSLRVRSTP